GDLALPLHEPQHGEVDVHVSLRYSDLVRHRLRAATAHSTRAGWAAAPDDHASKNVGPTPGRAGIRLVSCPTRAPSSRPSTDGTFPLSAPTSHAVSHATTSKISQPTCSRS